MVLINPSVIMVRNKLAYIIRVDFGVIAAKQFFTAVGPADWQNGRACGSCAELEYKGRVITVNVVDRFAKMK